MKDFLSIFPGKSYLVFLLATLSLISLSIYHYTSGLDNAIDWIVTSNTEIQKVAVDAFTSGLFNFSIPADNHLIWETFGATSMQVNLSYLYLILATLLVGMPMIHAAISYFPRIPFLIANVILIFLITFIHLEQTMPFGSPDRLPVYIFIGLLLGLGYLFQAFLQETKAILRFLTFLVVYVMMGAAIYYTSTIDWPYLMIAPYAFNAAVILTVLFIAATAQEVIYFILMLSGRTASSIRMNNGKHFLILSTLYLINLLLLYLRNAGHIRVDLSVANEFTLLVFSTLIAFYTIREKKVLFGSIGFNPWGYYLLGALGIIGFGLIASQAAMVNDPVMDSMEDIISYTHLAFGTMFFFYVIMNFLNPLFQNLQVYRIVYKEVNFPFLTSILGGMVGVAAFFFLANKTPYFEVRAGYFNLHGDINFVKGDLGLARRYYEQGGLYGGNNHKSYYQLATISAIEKDKADFETFMKRSFMKNPSEYAFIRLSDFYKQEGDFFNALFVLREGLQKFPKSSALRNNIAVMYTNLNILDSALIYLDNDLFDSRWENMSVSNSWYVYTKSNLSFEKDSIETLLAETNNPSVQSNYLAYANSRGLQLTLDNFSVFEDSLLTNSKLSVLNNLAVNNTKIPQNIFDIIINRSNVVENATYATVLDYDAVVASYHKGDFNTALRILDRLQGGNASQKGHFLNISGLIALKNGAYRIASEFFRRSLESGDQSAQLNYGIALSEAGMTEEAIRYWNRLELITTDSSIAQVAFNMSNNLSMSIKEVMGHENDVLKYQFLKYNGINLSFAECSDILETIMDENAIIGAVNDQIYDLINTGRYTEAEAYEALALSKNLPITPKNQLALALAADNMETLKSLRTENELLQLLVDQKTDTSSLKIMADLAIANPFDITTVLVVIDHLKNNNQLQWAYEVAQAALEINRYSVPLIKTYALTAVEANYTNYGETALLQLLDLVDSEEYHTFEARFDELKQEVENRDTWDF